jgi:hypothetical protein
MKFGMWEVRSLYRAGSLMIVSEGLSNYKIFMGAQEVRWDRGGTEPAGKCTFSVERGMTILNSVRVSWCIREYLQLAVLHLLVTDVIHNTERSLV